MYGWINDCIEKMVLSKFGLETWEKIKENAECSVLNGGWIRHEYYTDASTLNLVGAANAILEIEVDVILEVFGQYFMEFVRGAGYENLLRCQGSSLREWLANLNELHDHLESNLRDGKFIKPEFWCTDDKEGFLGDETYDGNVLEIKSIILHYFSQRGSLLSPIVVGIVKEVAKYFFCIEIDMQRIATQDVDDSKYTTWRIIKTRVVDECNALVPEYYNSTTRGKLSAPYDISSSVFLSEIKHKNLPQSPKESPVSAIPLKCPFSFSTLDIDMSNQNKGKGLKILPTSPANSNSTLPTPVGLSHAQLQKIFPFHVAIDKNFKIIQIGDKMLNFFSSAKQLLNKQISTIFQVISPPHINWDWNEIGICLHDQAFILKVIGEKIKSLDISFKGGLTISANPFIAIFLIAPHVSNFDEMIKMDISLSDLPKFGFQRDLVLLGEHLKSETSSAYELDVLSKQLEVEKQLSESLLHQMLPPNVADDLRAGRSVPPEYFDNVTVFFSDIVGFSKISSSLQPSAIVDMLNELYVIMDSVASKFSLYKVETIGDAYMVCCGLPTPDANHAINIANFALIVKEAVRSVKSPVDGTPISIRMGIHTGSVMAGVVGNLMPRYCLFGASVNTASRHESTGEPNRIHCSSAFADLLTQSNNFVLSKRGRVEMKGIGEQETFWLERATVGNVFSNEDAILRWNTESDKLVRSAKANRPKYSHLETHCTTNAGLS